MNVDIQFVNIESCSRCKGEHKFVKIQSFVKFAIANGKNDEDAYNYWGLCPVTEEPFLMEEYVDNSNLLSF